MIKKYTSKPFEAFELKSDMSNWREAYQFLGIDFKESDTTPQYIEFLSCENGWFFAVGPAFIAKTPNQDFEVRKWEEFVENFIACENDKSAND